MMLACSPGTIFERGQSIRKVATTRGVPVHGFLETAGPDLGNVDIVFGAGLGVFIDENSISPGGLELASMARGVASILQRKGIHRPWTQCPENEQSRHREEEHGTKGSRSGRLVGKAEHCRCLML